ncbi:rop guanine nucleotide exchange factor 12-like [Impatiens glandulifera]|uniref:rop guanine nucleotide exchange factor 12-like n=1 Tax=Impatiens glandulifera TaxID=253017 RepID=UPI001FB0C4BF|nr:rop guanine nucleotide exchange factor 12-like [Impatiens glandulifera]
MDQMKEKFAKLLLGEDMSGGGKGVSSALALSNAITNLAASAFGEQRKLEPMATETKIRWKKEIDWLLSVTDYIVEMVPVKQKAKDGSMMEVMTTRQRTDLLMNIPALRKLDTMLIDCLDNFKDQSEFTYVSKTSADESSKSNDKWWIPTPKVPLNGLSETTRKWIQFQKDSVNQVLKAAMAINAMVLAEMEIPENYIDSLPKVCIYNSNFQILNCSYNLADYYSSFQNGRSSLGESVYRNITVDHFDPDHFLLSMDLTSELKILDLKNRIEASIVIWKRKMVSKDNKAWGSAVTLEKREQFEDRAETILLIIKHRFPGIPQSSLEISKIQYNKDVGQAILESYSRIIESLAFTVLSRIDDVINADANTRNPPVVGEHKRNAKSSSSIKSPNDREELERLSSGGTASSMTLFDFMDWREDQADSDQKDSTEDAKYSSKSANADTNRRFSYAETLGNLRSPNSRH